MAMVLIDNNNEAGHGDTDVWLLSDEPWQIQSHAMVLSRFIAEQVILNLWLMTIECCIYVT